MSYTLIDNKDKHQYEFNIDGIIPKIEYILTQNEIYLTHAEVPEELKGKGIASELTKQVLEDIEKRNLRLVPLCPFVAGYIKRHPEWKKLVLKGIDI